MGINKKAVLHVPVAGLNLLQIQHNHLQCYVSVASTHLQVIYCNWLETG